jgi:hypothetical protein
MRSSKFLSCISASIVCVAGIANGAYLIEDTYDESSFFDAFSFFDGADPTAGFVEYVAAGTANLSALAGYSSNAVYLGVDYTTLNPPGGRQSVRISSNKAYTRGLFIADIAHMPGSICGVWPAFWTFGPNWPASGEIDIIEGVNQQTTDSVTLHTSAGCTMSATGSLTSSTLANADCNAGDAGTGCSISTVNTQAYGDGFNEIGGGVYASMYYPRSFLNNLITCLKWNGRPHPSMYISFLAAISQ